MNSCPKCNSPLQEDARFCPHCMTKFDQKQTIEKAKQKNNKTIKIVIILILIMAIVTGSVFIFKNHNKHEIICSFPQFQVASQIVSERMGINDLWDVTEFKEIYYFKTNDVIQYSTNIYLHDAFLSLFFYNKGEEVYSYICDVEPSDFSKAESLLKCITRCVCNNYFTDLDDIFDNEKVYPKQTLDEPFDSYFTDMLKRTDDYNLFIDNGGTIKTKYIPMTNDEIICIFYVIERNNNGSILYDLAVDIERN